MAGGEETAIDPQHPVRGLAPGTMLNGIYRIEERLGAGGMGEVYRAVNVNNDEQDAIKMIGQLGADRTMIEALFRREARVLSRIRAPGVAQLKLFARDTDLDLLYLVTDFVPGESLLDRLGRQPGSPAELRTLLRRLLTGLQAVHDAGAVHRDLSPDDIILPDSDPAHATIIDFGIAKDLDPARSTLIGDAFAGKLGYIAPEQLGFSGAEIGPWTDLYSLALVAIAFVAGKPLDMGATVGRAEEARRGVIDLSAVPADLRPVFGALLTYDWRGRPRSAAAVLAMLDGAPAEPAGAPPAPDSTQAPTAVLPRAAPPPPAPTRSGLLIPALLMLLVAVVAVGLFLILHRSPPATVDRAGPARPPQIVTPMPSSVVTPAIAAPGAVAVACGPAITVAFSPNRAAMPPGAAPLVSGAVDRVALCHPKAVAVTGKAQTTEPASFDLAQRRADTIAAALRAAGVPAGTVVIDIHVASPDPAHPGEDYRDRAVEVRFVDR